MNLIIRNKKTIFTTQDQFHSSESNFILLNLRSYEVFFSNLLSFYKKGKWNIFITQFKKKRNYFRVSEINITQIRQINSH